MSSTLAEASAVRLGRRFTVALQCGHPGTFTHAAPDTGDIVWCARCARFVWVLETVRTGPGKFSAEHGTEAGYQRHKRDPAWPDKRCDACKAAVAVRQRERSRRRPTTRAGRKERAKVDAQARDGAYSSQDAQGGTCAPAGAGAEVPR